MPTTECLTPGESALLADAIFAAMENGDHAAAQKLASLGEAPWKIREILGGDMELSTDAHHHEHRGKGEGGGQFTSGSSGGTAAAKKKPSPKSAPTSEGKKFSTPESAGAVKELLSGKTSHEMFTKEMGGKRDTFLDAVLTESGRGDPPKLVDASGMDDLKKKGWTVFYRGVKNPDANEQFKTGEIYNGSGLFGNGTYVQREGGVLGVGGKSAKGAIAEARSYGQHVMRVALPPHARVASLSTIENEQKAYAKELGERRWKNEITQEDYAKLMAVSEDVGRFAALKNYQAVYCTWGGYFNLLDRSILAVQKEDVV